MQFIFFPQALRDLADRMDEVGAEPHTAKLLRGYAADLDQYEPHDRPEEMVENGA